MSSENPVNVDVKLGINKFHVNEGHPHIILVDNPNMDEFRKLMLACLPGCISKTAQAISISILRLSGVRHLPRAVRRHHS
ncbi:ferredoxin-like protein FixX [Serratia fonticola]|uniref:Ferredoxin-like protein FixX n=1 Tax=Serratia fonticola TaxID=47917 RepID=A0A4U9TSW4_SERFO|nr:ferredoxin-like protein FixX [Serratia fonticola]